MKAPRRFACPAFTLLEIIIVLAIAAVLIGLCIPFISGMLREAQMREPVRELQALAKAMRNRSMTERVPYEITFNAEGFQGCKHALYAENSDDGPSGAGGPSRSARPATGASPKTTGSAAASSAATSGTSGDDSASEQEEPIAAYPFPPEMTCQILYWGNSQWVDPAAADQDQCRWVFQPSGLCNPIRVKFQKGAAWIEAAFNPLTADIQEERYLFPN